MLCGTPVYLFILGPTGGRFRRAGIRIAMPFHGAVASVVQLGPTGGSFHHIGNRMEMPLKGAIADAALMAAFPT